MNIAVAHPGALKESWFREAFAEYQKRTSPFASLPGLCLPLRVCANISFMMRPQPFPLSRRIG